MPSLFTSVTPAVSRPHSAPATPRGLRPTPSWRSSSEGLDATLAAGNAAQVARGVRRRRSSDSDYGRDVFEADRFDPRKPLSEVLFQTVARAHMVIAGHAFFDALNAGSLSRDAYVRYLSDRLVICSALEEGLRKIGGRVGDIASLHFDRRDAVLSDLHALGEFSRLPSPAATALASRILKGPALTVVTHAWVEYMGMLHGGQGMKRKLKQQFGTANFVSFAAPARDLREQYTAALNATRVAPFERQDMCEEASEAFDMHMSVLDYDFDPAAYADANAEHDAQRSLWDTWRAAFTWVPGLFGAEYKAT